MLLSYAQNEMVKISILKKLFNNKRFNGQNSSALKLAGQLSPREVFRQGQAFLFSFSNSRFDNRFAREMIRYFISPFRNEGISARYVSIRSSLESLPKYSSSILKYNLPRSLAFWNGLVTFCHMFSRSIKLRLILSSSRVMKMCLM